MPTPVIPLDVKRAHLASAAALLDAEARANAVVQRSSRQGSRTGSRVAVARAAVTAVRPVLVASRTAARRAGALTLEREVDSLRPQLRAAGLPLARLAVVSERGVDDAAFAELVVSRYHDALLTELASEKNDGDGAAFARADRVLREGTTRLVSAGFNAERERVLKRTATEYQGAEWFPAVLRMWDSTLDRRTCSRCRDMEGQLRPLGIGFSGGLPGDVHSWCRCVSVVIFSPIFLGRKRAEAA